MIFKFGFSSYLKISKLICYYFYKNMLLVFVEIWLNVYSGCDYDIYFIRLLVTLYNFAFTTFQCLVALYAEKSSPGRGGDQSSIEAAMYYEGITNRHFNMRVFWGWTFSAIFHG